MREIKIGKRRIGSKYPTYFVAEIGGNFTSFEIGKKLITAAVNSGSDAVKIQTFTAENLVSKFATFDLPVIGGKKKQFDILKKLELDIKIQKKIFDYCKKKDITIFSTPSHKSDVDFLEENNTCAYKIGSDDFTNLPLIKYVSKLQKPTIISTGMANLKEVKDTVNAFYSTGNKKLILLHCVSMYPFEPKYANLQSILTMQKEFNIPVGWSDHTDGINVCFAAATLGANMIEKHFMLNKKTAGPDHMLSATPEKLTELIKNVKMIEQAKGNGIKVTAKCEKQIIKDIRKSVIAKKNILKGSKITMDLLEIKRPGTGIPPKKIHSIIGKRATKNIEKDMPLQFTFLK